VSLHPQLNQKGRQCGSLPLCEKDGRCTPLNHLGCWGLTDLSSPFAQVMLLGHSRPGCRIVRSPPRADIYGAQHWRHVNGNAASGAALSDCNPRFVSTRQKDCKAGAFLCSFFLPFLVLRTSFLFIRLFPPAVPGFSPLPLPPPLVFCSPRLSTPLLSHPYYILFPNLFFSFSFIFFISLHPLFYIFRAFLLIIRLYIRPPLSFPLPPPPLSPAIPVHIVCEFFCLPDALHWSNYFTYMNCSFLFSFPGRPFAHNRLAGLDQYEPPACHHTAPDSGFSSVHILPPTNL